MPTVRPKKGRESKAPPSSKTDDESLAARLAHAEEELGHMLVQLSKAEDRARRAERSAAQSSDERISSLIGECEALKNAMREAATILLRAISPTGRAVPPPLPPVVDVSEIAEMVVDSRRTPPGDA